MILLILLSPIVGALVIMAGAPARRTALCVSLFAFILSLVAFGRFETGGGFQFVNSWPILPDWHLNFTVGVDGLSLLMVLLTTIVYPGGGLVCRRNREIPRGILHLSPFNLRRSPRRVYLPRFVFLLCLP